MSSIIAHSRFSLLCSVKTKQHACLDDFSSRTEVNDCRGR